MFYVVLAYFFVSDKEVIMLRQTATSSTVVLLYYLLFQGALRCQCNPIASRTFNLRPHLSQIVSSKRNVFLSRGWGAAGTPFNNFFLAPAMPMQQKYHSELNYQQYPPKQELRRSTYRDDEENLLPVAEYLIQSPHQIEQTDYRNEVLSKNHHVIPQLFVSYGWGPLGK